MSTPLLGAANRYLREGRSRFHMPGHKGMPLEGLGDITRYDLTEAGGLDSLYHAAGAIAETEAAFTKLYGTAASFLSAGGSTLCIQAMLALAAAPGSKVLAARGVHTAAVNAMALLDLQPVWIYPEQDALTGLAGTVSPQAVEAALQKHPDVSAVYITSPTYYGVLSDIAGIKAVCGRYGVPLLVDNAHGAHLKFRTPSLHPVDLGADLCCDSLHKTLPVLTGGALLHVCDERYVRRAKERMALFGSTSPSYLIMLSADAALPYLRDRAGEDIARVSHTISSLSDRARQKGFLTPRGVLEPLRLTLGFSPLGCTAEAFYAHLQSCRIEPEYLGGGYCVLIAGPQNSGEDFRRLREAIDTLPPQPPLPVPGVRLLPAEQVLSPRQAAFRDSGPVPVAQAVGQVAGGMVAPCPPGIPIVIGGERIDRDCAQALKNCGIRTVNVIK